MCLVRPRVLEQADILRRIGPDGITQDAPAYDGNGGITDDTQITTTPHTILVSFDPCASAVWRQGAFAGDVCVTLTVTTSGQ